ncbi:ferredoxin family protein [Eubacteriaceae bacterium ES3]|nr:ferredoxin family protein [Eubacteriaceae bacterium ES3]
MSESTFMGVDREKIDWCPTIDYDKCNDCMDCVEFCPHKVFEVRENETPKLIVKNPKNCVVFCRACSKTCGLDALSFPDKNETTRKIKATRKAEKAAKKEAEE